jgi:copper chaperone
MQINPHTNRAISRHGLTLPSWQGSHSQHHPFKESAMEQSFQVQGMSCGHCERAVTQAVQHVDPQAQVRIERSTGKVEVQSTAAREQLAKAIEEEGYTVAT